MYVLMEIKANIELYYTGTPTVCDIGLPVFPQNSYKKSTDSKKQRLKHVKTQLELFYNLF